MSISVECPACRALNAISNTVCSSCQIRIPPLNRKVWLRYKINGRSRKECLGIIPLKEAKEIEIQRLAEIPRILKSNDMTWSDVAVNYITKIEAEKRSRNYINDTKLYLERFKDYVRDKPVSLITATDVKAFKTFLRSTNLSEATCDRHLQAGKAAWNYSVEEFKNPFSKVKLFNPDNITERSLSDEQRFRLLDAASKIGRTFYEIMVVTMNTGFRKAEVLNLKRSQVDFNTGVVRIRQKRNLSHTTFLNDSCRSMLRAIPHNGTDYFWVSAKTKKPYRNDWRSAWEKAKSLAGLPADFRWHDLRHDVGTLIYAATHDLQAVQRFLGHRQIKTTQRYAHTNPEYLREISEKLNVALDRCPEGVLKLRKKK